GRGGAAARGPGGRGAARAHRGRGHGARRHLHGSHQGRQLPGRAGRPARALRRRRARRRPLQDPPQCPRARRRRARLGDGKQPVRDASRQLLVTLMEVSSPTIIVERAGSYAWTHKSWRVREEFVRTLATAVGLFASTELLLQRVFLSPVLQLLNDLNQSVREAAISCIQEMYKNMGSQFHEELQRHNLPSYMLKEINSRLDKIEPKAPPSDGARTQYRAMERSVSAHPKRGSPRKKNTSRESTLFGGDTDITEKPVEPIRVHSEKELFREIEKIASALNPEKDWSIRIAAMQRIEALVYGGAIDYPSFFMLLKQLVHPLSSQLADRRSSIVKQACHLLNVLSKELLSDFEACAEIFIPVIPEAVSVLCNSFLVLIGLTY
uniref:Uncharacterized protein n=1 Tax=Aegilops tauschii subsp. strangulata TaxID=200361 RepID=A0A453P3G1_AEGTS